MLSSKERISDTGFAPQINPAFWIAAHKLSIALSI
jgi:hypothetical protein